MPNQIQQKFKEIIIIYSNKPTNICCTTTVYSFGAKILETKQDRDFREFKKDEAGYRNSFEFVPHFFTAFFAGLLCLEVDEIQIAIDNLTVVQVFFFLTIGL